MFDHECEAYDRLENGEVDAPKSKSWRYEPNYNQRWTAKGLMEIIKGYCKHCKEQIDLGFVVGEEKVLDVKYCYRCGKPIKEEDLAGGW